MLIAGVGVSQTPSPADSLKIKKYTLSPIRIIAERPAQSIGAITIKDLDTAAKTLNLADALKQISGISITQGSKDESNLKIRGFRKNEVLVLVDGRPLNSGYFGNVNLSAISPADISKAVVIKGPASALYGTNTMGGVVNLIRSEPPLGSTVDLGIHFKRNNTHLMDLQASRRFKAMDISFHASRSHSDGFVLSQAFEPTFVENGGVRNNAKNTVYSGGARLYLQQGIDNSFAFSAGSSYSDTKQIPASVYESKFRLYKDWMRSDASLMADIRLGEWSRLYSMLYYDAAGDTYHEYGDAAYQVLHINSRMKNHSLGFNPRLAMDLMTLGELSLGLRAQRIQNRRKDNGNYPEWTQSTMDIFGAFVHYELQRDLDYSFSMGTSSHSLDNDYKGKWLVEPAMRVAYKAETGMELSLGSGINSAYPTMRQLFSIDRGNPNLLPQHAVKTELNFSQAFTKLPLPFTFQSSIFHNYVRDLIEVKDGYYQNIFQVQSIGYETGILLKATSFWDIDMQYAYLKQLENAEYQLTESPKHSIELQNVFHLPAETKLFISSSVYGKRLSMDSGGEYHSLGSYRLFSARVAKTFGKWKLELGLENILDENYEMEYGFPAPGRNFSIGAVYSIFGN